MVTIHLHPFTSVPAGHPKVVGGRQVVSPTTPLKVSPLHIKRVYGFTDFWYNISTFKGIGDLLSCKIHVYPNSWSNMFFVSNIMIVNRVGDLSEKDYPASLKRRWNSTSPIKEKPAIQKFNACQLLLCSLFLPIENKLQRPKRQEFTTTSGFLVLRSGWTIWWWQQLWFVERYQDGQTQFDLHAELDEGFSRVPCIEKAIVF